MNKEKIIERIEKELLSALLDYLVPLVNQKIKPKAEIKPQNLENIVLNSKPKIGIEDFKQVIELISMNRDVNTRSQRNSTINSRNAAYSVTFARTKESKTRNYSVTIRYEENSNTEITKIESKKSGKIAYYSEIINEKESKDRVAPYKVTITYEDRYGEERLTITYSQQLKNYMKKHVNEKEDMTSRVPLKWLNVLPESMMGGVLGFTYIGDPAMGRRADLTGWMARMVDIHESIHTPDEYETRRLTDWIMSKEKPKYIK